MLLRFVALALAVVVLFVCAAAWYVGSRLIEPQNHTVAMPAGFAVETVSIPGRGHAIAGWWVDVGKDSPVVLLVHGIGADRSQMVAKSELLKRHGFSSLLIDLQAEGETRGDAITLGHLESLDVVAARDWIKRTAPGRKIGVIGTSLGGASVLLAPQPSGFDAVVLESVFPRIGRAVENRVRMRLGFLAPVLTPLLLWQLQPRLHIAVADLEPIREIGRLGAPVLVAAGSKDRHTTLEETQELFDAASQPKSLWIVEGAIHEDLLTYDPSGYEAHVVGFLEKNLKGPSVGLAVIEDAAQLFASVSKRDNAAVGAALDAAVSPLQFRRVATSGDPPNPKGLVAAYTAGTLADAQLFEASRPGCFYIHVENYDSARVGLAGVVLTAIERAFRASFGRDVAFFSDSKCSHALYGVGG